MTANTTTLSSVAYGRGTYVASASSFLNTDFPAWKVFDFASATLWHAGSGFYDLSGNYTGSTTTVLNTGSAVAGEWLQLQQPVSTIVSQYSIQNRVGYLMQAPVSWSLLASHNGNAWVSLDSRSNISLVDGQLTAFSVSNNTIPYSYYRLVFTKSASTGTVVALAAFVLTGTQESLFIDSDGHVGIGVSNAVNMLDVSGTASFGNVGVGLSNPQALLHVQGLSRFQGNAGTTQFVGIDHVYQEFYPRGTAAGRKAYIGYPGSNNNVLVISNVDTSNVINLDGVVSIGTSSTLSPLTVYTPGGNAMIDLCTLWAGASTNNDGSRLRLGGSPGQHFSAIGGKHVGNGLTELHLQTTGNVSGGDTNDPQTRMMINGIGNVGIGTTSPEKSLHVAKGDQSIARFGPNSSYNSYLNVGASAGPQLDSTTAHLISTNGNLHLDCGNGKVTYINYYVNGNGTTTTHGIFSYGTWTHTGTISKTGGSFDIVHPDPVKAEHGYRLRHCFVESPTRGDNLYRFQVTTTNKVATLSLPDYYPHLNENTQIFVTAEWSDEGAIGSGCGRLNPTNPLHVDVRVTEDGVYNVLIVGTRKDQLMKDFWDDKGAEYIREK